MSLPELLIVIVALGVLAAFAAPRFATGSANDEAGFRGELMDALRAARWQATAARCEVRFTVSGGGYSAHRRAGLCSGTFDVAASGGAAADDTLAGTTPPSIALSASPAVFYFDAFGRALAAPGGAPQNVAITIGTRQIVVVGETGHVGLQ